MEKTAREWLNEMPEPYRTLAFDYINPNNLNEIFSKPYYALDFDWGLSPEGHDFWNKIYGCLMVNKPVSKWPPIPNQPEPPTTEPDKYALFQLAIRPLQLNIGELASNALFDIAQMVLNNPDGGDIKQLSQILTKHKIK